MDAIHRHYKNETSGSHARAWEPNLYYSGSHARAWELSSGSHAPAWVSGSHAGALIVIHKSKIVKVGWVGASL